MREIKKMKMWIFAFLAVSLFGMFLYVKPMETQAATNAKIHYLTLPDNTLSVLVECNGRFGMIDSGEDTDYPKGTDSRYPARAHITKTAGYENQVIKYLKSVGVTTSNMDFYIGTHPHSDHIGSADEVIKAFKPKKVYIQEYKDSYISDANALWDNLYVYDCMVNAAKSAGSTLIQNINSSNANFKLGDVMEIQIKHYGGSYKTSPVPDANYFSLGVLVKANGKTAFVSGDINNFDGSETTLTAQLGHVDVLTLGHHGYYGSNSYNYVTGLTPKMLILPGTYSGVSSNALPNDKDLFTTLMEMGKKGVPLYATGWYTNEMGAIVINFNSSLSTNIPSNSVKTVKTQNTVPAYNVQYKNGIPTSCTAIAQWVQEAGGWWYRHADGSYTTNNWELIDGKWYYFNGDGWMVTGWIQLKGIWYYLDPASGAMATGWKTIGGQSYYFTSDGAMLANGWQQIGSSWYYFNADGARVTGWIQLKGLWYYLNPSNGAMVTNWQTISGKQYYFYSDGHMAANTWIGNKYVDASGAWNPNQPIGTWIKQSGRWWYKHYDGSYTRNNWELIEGKWYYFDADGWMVTGWLNLGGTWYYLYSDGSKATNTWIEGCYLNANGVWVK